MSLKNKKILITGGAGFIGSKIAEYCVKKGLEVRVFDLMKSSVAGIAESMEGSILDPYELTRAMRGCDWVVHAAAALGVQRTETRRLECLHINIQGTVNVLESAVKEKVQKILFTSSSEVYGDQNLKSYDESAPVMPKSNYAITKLVGEEYLRAYRISYGLEYTVVRMFNVYGENQSDSFVIPIFANNILAGKEPVIYGDGKQVRSFCHVDDAANGAVSALIAPGTEGEIYNIGNDREPITITDLAKKMIGDRKIEPRYVHFDKSDREEKREILWRVPSIEKAKKTFNYEPQISLSEGLARVMRYRAAMGLSPAAAF